VIDGRSCPACGTSTTDVAELARHLVKQAEMSDGKHVMWLNRYVTKHRTTAPALEELLRHLLAGGPPAAARVRR
jgi:hypothetical protein